MSRIKNSDCPLCGKWMAECDCDPAYPDNSGEAIDRAMAEMQEESFQYFEQVKSQDPAEPPF